jgi:hypothetical protein
MSKLFCIIPFEFWLEYFESSQTSTKQRMSSQEIQDHLLFEPVGIIERISLCLDAVPTSIFVCTHRRACIIMGLERIDSRTAYYKMQPHTLEEPRSAIFKGKPERLQ